MHKVSTDDSHAIVEFLLEGMIRVDEMMQFVVALKRATESLKGREIKIKADVRAFQPASPEVAEMIRGVQMWGLQNGVTRVAEIVESEIVALQLNRVARESGTDKILRRFWEDESAREWLIHGGGSSPDSSSRKPK